MGQSRFLNVQELSALPELRNVIMPFGGTTADIETDLSSEELLKLFAGVSERLHGQVTFLPLDKSGERER